MRYPEDGECQESGSSKWSNAVSQHAEPGIELVQFLPPLDFNRVGRNRSRQDEQRDRRDNQYDCNARRPGRFPSVLDLVLRHSPKRSTCKRSAELTNVRGTNKTAARLAE